MRDYSRVSSAFWTGETGRLLRKNKDAQIVALYLITCPHANMIGVFRCPIIYISHETGLSIEGASKGLQCLLDVAFCTYEKDSELVFVHAMAKYQVGDEIKPKDKRQDSVQKQFNSLPEGIVKQGFFDRYGDAYNLIYIKPLASPLQAPPKPEAGTGAELETEIKEKNTKKEKIAVAFVLPDWINQDDWNLWIKTRKKKMLPEQMQAQVRKLEKWKEAGLDYASSLYESAINGWQKLVDPPQTSKQNMPQSSGKAYHEKITDTLSQVFGDLNHGNKHQTIDITPEETDRSGAENLPEVRAGFR